MAQVHERKLRRGQIEDEDASKLQLGVFQNVGCLTISEVKHLIDKRQLPPPDMPVFKKAYDYVQTFARFKTQDAAMSVREVFKKDESLHQFEAAQIGNLCPEEVDEARTLIPSLQNHDEQQLQALLDEVATLRKFQS